MSFLTELKRRNVIRMAGLYAVGSWLIVQVAGTVFPAFDVPSWGLRAVIIVLVIGFAPALEYNVSPTLGFLAGLRVLMAGHNSKASLTPAIAINYVM